MKFLHNAQFVLFAAVLISACGQGPHVTAPGASKSGSGGSASTEPSAQSQPEVTAEGSVLIVEKTPEQLDAEKKNDGSLDQAAKDGKDGNDGKDGKDSDSTVTNNSGTVVENNTSEKTDKETIVKENGLDKDAVEKELAKAKEELERKIKEEQEKLQAKLDEELAKSKLAADGKDGKDGRDGKDGGNACASTVLSKENISIGGALSTALDDHRKSNGADLPYNLRVLNKKGKVVPGTASVSLLTLGGSNAGTKANPYVLNAQVLFEITLNLPPRNKVLADQPISSKLNLGLYKKSNDKILKTEMICLMDEKICSGDMYEDKNFKALINHSSNYMLANNEFSKQMISKVKNEEGVNSTQFDMKLLFSKTGKALTDEELLDLLYGSTANSSSDKWITRTLRVVVADDTLVSKEGTSLDLRLSYDGCSVTK
jgi:hypothetical protein